MSLEVGGRADKLGNEYEKLWVVRLALTVVEGDAQWLLWEPSGEAGRGVELRIGIGNDAEDVHQCKRENGVAGRWTPGDLKEVLESAKVHLGRPGVRRFVFVSRDCAPVLADLSERSHRCDNDPEVFLSTCLTSRNHKEGFSYVAATWALDPQKPTDAAEILRLLQGLKFRVWDDAERDFIERFATRLAKGSGRDLISCIGDFLVDRLGNTLYSEDFRRHLTASGHPPINVSLGDVAIVIDRLILEFEESVGAALIGDAIIPRPETAELTKILGDPDGARVIFLHGRSGAGKSAVLLELIRTFEGQGQPALPLRLDIHRPSTTLEAFNSDLGLIIDPGASLAALAAGRRAVLVIDQLDAIRWTGAHASRSWFVCREMIERALDYSNLRAVIACRSFDLADDQQIRLWESNARTIALRRFDRVEVTEFSDDLVRSVLVADGVDVSHVTRQAISLLSNPQCLYIWRRLRREASSMVRFFQTQSDLLAEYFAMIREQLVRMGIPVGESNALIDAIASYIDRQGRLDVPRSLALMHKSAMEGLCSLGILQQVSGCVRFTHQSYADYLIAERVLKDATTGGTSLLEWLRQQDQSLARRQQLRQLLALLRDRDPALYATTLRGLFYSDEIRFHLKHLILNHLRVVVHPNREERALVVELAQLSEWRKHVLQQSVATNASWFDALDEAGVLRAWLSSADEATRQDGAWLCRLFVADRASQVERHLAALWSVGDRDSRELVDWALPFNIREHTNLMIAWRIENIKQGIHPVDFHEVERLAKTDPRRSLELFEAGIFWTLHSLDAISDDLPRVSWDDDKFHELDAACSSNAKDAWNRLTPLLSKAIQLGNESGGSLETAEARTRYTVLRDVTPILERLVSIAGAEIAHSDWQDAIALVESLNLPVERVLQRVVARTLLGGPPHAADYAIRWLSESPDRFYAGTSERMVNDPARLIVEKFSTICSDACYGQLETAVGTLHPHWESESVRRQLEVFRSNSWIIKNSYGYTQNRMLSAMSDSRLSVEARIRRDTWRAKFKTSEEEFAGRLGGGWVGSPVYNKIDRISDHQWISIITRDWSARSRSHRQAGPDHVIEVSPSTFSEDLRRAAHKEPTRFARLALRIPVTANTIYFEALVRGLAATKPPESTTGEATQSWQSATVLEIESVFEHVAEIKTEELVKAICWLVRDRASESWSPSTRSLIREKFTSLRSVATVQRAGDGERPTEDLEMSTLNSAPGAIAHTIAALLFADIARANEFLPTIRAMCEDPNAAVRLAAMTAILPIYNFDQSTCAELFLAACSHADDRILNGHATQEVIHHLRFPYPDQIRPILERMVRNDVGSQLGAYWSIAQRYTLNRDFDLADMCVAGSTKQRTGCVEALVSLCRSDEYRATASESLRGFFVDPDEAVAKEALGVFDVESVLSDPEVGPALALSFSTSPTFGLNPGWLVRHLENWEGELLPYAAPILAAVARFAELPANSTPRRTLEQDISTVLLRLYDQVLTIESKELAARCLDAWDELLRAGIGAIEEQLKKMDG